MAISRFSSRKQVHGSSISPSFSSACRCPVDLTGHSSVIGLKSPLAGLYLGGVCVLSGRGRGLYRKQENYMPTDETWTVSSALSENKSKTKERRGRAKNKTSRKETLTRRRRRRRRP